MSEREMAKDGGCAGKARAADCACGTAALCARMQRLHGHVAAGAPCLEGVLVCRSSVGVGHGMEVQALLPRHHSIWGACLAGRTLHPAWARSKGAGGPGLSCTACHAVWA